MAYNQNNYYYQGQHQVPVPPTAYGQHYEAPQPKTPSSMNDYSPNAFSPLRTPPHSRGPSQAPEQDPDQMIYDEVGSSSSNSDTSARTPDHEGYDIDMFESVPSYQPNQAGPMMTTQTSQGGVAAPDMGMNMYFPNHVLQQTLHDVLAQQPYNPQLNAQQQQQQHQNVLRSQIPQGYAQHNSQSYSAQSHRHEPWNGVAPPRNPAEPRSGVTMFDPQTDPFDYNTFVNFDAVGWPSTANWTMDNTAPNYLIPPDTGNNPLFLATQNLGPMDVVMDLSPSESRLEPSPTDAGSNSSPLEMRVQEASPSPDSQNFVNFNSSSAFFTNNYITDSFSQSRGTSVVGHAGHSPYQSAVSPQASVPSPMAFPAGPHSSSTVVPDRYASEQIDPRSLYPPSPLQLNKASPRTIPDVTFDQDEDMDVAQSQPTAGRGPGGRTGGRQLGTHLQAEVAKAAHDMRKIVACWHCVLQRDKCGPGDVCERCLKRSQRPNADCGLGCSRIKLVELTQYFLPSLLMSIHENAHLIQFADMHINSWYQQEITIKMTCGQKKMPRFEVKVYEFSPRDRTLMEQIQYNTNKLTLQREPKIVKSPALGMQHINFNDEKRYDKYINDIVDGHLHEFSELCWMEDDNDFQERLFRLLLNLKPKRDDEAKLLREVFRLIVCTFIMSHTLSMAEETKHASLSRMRSYKDPSKYVPKFTSPRLTNRQLKYFFARLQKNILQAVLNKVQQIFKSSKGCDKWLAAFIAAIGMAMAHEDQQKTLHLVMETKAHTEGWDMHHAEDSAKRACKEIDERMSFIFQIFRWKYNRRCNPLKDSEQEWEKEAGFGDANSVNFIRQVAQLVKENIDFLSKRQNVDIGKANQTKYTSRLVGQFLLSFWLPQ
ncbi:hypothetical protein BDV96DRAFT_503498 [Lophiotrema nucula]|uniref:Uncharacterized protein n=1 Tax=Lophiotrema nucula TaxID=690887 RepID=A0A6A5YP84_9PLEO|nr:hypothetical protein BDV96DRAFT_503498 [Lophiotrema nucula]